LDRYIKFQKIFFKTLVFFKKYSNFIFFFFLDIGFDLIDG
jgi:hypothetical protein